MSYSKALTLFRARSMSRSGPASRGLTDNDCKGFPTRKRVTHSLREKRPTTDTVSKHESDQGLETSLHSSPVMFDKTLGLLLTATLTSLNSKLRHFPNLSRKISASSCASMTAHPSASFLRIASMIMVDFPTPFLLYTLSECPATGQEKKFTLQ